MARRMILVLAATLLAALAVPALPALAGGGCHDGATTGEGDTVEMKDACFRPSTLQIAPGDTVTFVNRDAMTHNVSAMGWGHFEDMAQGDVFTATFSAEGVYPFACQYHPAMTGAIVVGSGLGAGNGEDVTVAAYEAPASSETSVATQASSGSNATVGWLTGGAIGVAAGFALGFLVRRRRTA
jgi:plastocyanin